MCKKLFIAAACLIFTCFSVPAHSETWEEVKPRVEEMLSQTPIPCDKMWDEIWPWFKRGEPDVIIGFAMGSAGLADFFPPLSKYEEQARQERSFLTVYYTLARAGKLRQDVSKKVTDIPVNTSDEYLLCTQRYSEEDCAETAMAGGNVPAFDDFISVIEGRVQAGHKMMCRDRSEK